MTEPPSAGAKPRTWVSDGEPLHMFIRRVSKPEEGGHAAECWCRMQAGYKFHDDREVGTHRKGPFCYFWDALDAKNEAAIEPREASQ